MDDAHEARQLPPSMGFSTISSSGLASAFRRLASALTAGMPYRFIPVLGSKDGNLATKRAQAYRSNVAVSRLKTRFAGVAQLVER